MLPLTIRADGDARFDEHDLAKVHTWRDLSGEVSAYGYVGKSGRWIRWPGAVAFRFNDEGSVEAFPESRIDHAHVVDLCRRVVEPLVLQALGRETLHASGVVMADGLVAFCGERESGKSTIAFSLARRGYRQFSDDTVVLQVRPEGVRGFQLPFGVRLRREAATFFGFGAARDLRDVAPAGVRDAARTPAVPLTAIFVLRRMTTGAPVVERLTASAAFTALLAHAHCFDPEDAQGRRRLLENYLHVADAIPVYELRFAEGLERLESVLTCVERTVCAALVRTA